MSTTGDDTAPSAQTTDAAASGPSTGPDQRGEPDPSSGHSCEHCGGHDGPDPVSRAVEHVALATRRLVPRLAVGVIGVIVALVVASQRETSVLAAGATAAGAAAAWLVAASGGLMLAGWFARGRGPRAQIALGGTAAAALAPLLGLGLALAFGNALAVVIAAAAGWFLASSVAEWVRVRTLRRLVARSDDEGATARFEAQRLTVASIARAESLALAIALVFGAAVWALASLPWLVVVGVPLAAAGASVVSIRASRANEPQRRR